MLWFRAPEKVYIKRGCLPVALEELKNVMNKKRVFIVTDTFLYENGYTKGITDKLDEMGIVHETFFNVAPDPTLACAKEGAKLEPQELEIESVVPEMEIKSIAPEIEIESVVPKFQEGAKLQP